MKEKEITEIVEEKFKITNKLCQEILKGFSAHDIHDFRVEIKKLRAFLRLMDMQHKIDGPLIPKQVKTFYGYVGIIRNIHLHKHSLFKYITDYAIDKPGEYIKLLDDEESYWKKEAGDLMEDNNFQDAQGKILGELPDKLEKPAIKKFVENKLDQIKEQLKEMNNETALHNVRKNLKDLLYTWDYTKAEADLPQAISKEEDLKTLATKLGDFRDKCIQLEFLDAEYLDKIKDDNESSVLLKIKDEFLHEKEIMMQELCYSLNDLNKQL